jgi:hypothetical protein
MSGWDWFWAVFTGAFVLVFAVGETTALVRHRMTYSEWIRKYLGISPKKRWGAAGAALFVMFAGWFVPHILN